jgi:ferritin-like metal-binding protein YciE
MSDSNNTLVSLHNLLAYDISKFMSAEILLRKSLGWWIDKTLSLEFKTVLRTYRDLVQQHFQKFEAFFEQDDIHAQNLNNRVMQALIEETDEKLSSCNNADLKDACLLACIQAINHYKISIYGTAAAFAKTLDLQRHAAVFHDAEINERQIDERLSHLAKNDINFKARTAFLLPG